MGFYGNVVICVMFVIWSDSGISRGIEYSRYQHCYYEGGLCSTKNISCDNGLVIDIVWARIGYSDYWVKDNNHFNCSVTNESCYKNVTQPATNCSGSPSCTLYTCSNVTLQQIDCTGQNATNYLLINYRCIEEKKSTIVISMVIIALGVIATVVVIIVIIKRRKIRSQSSQHLQWIITSMKSVKVDTDTDNVNYVTSHDVTKVKNTSGTSGHSAEVSETNNSVVDDDNCTSINVGGDYEPVDLTPSKTRLSDTELVDNVNYVGFGEEVTKPFN